MSYQRNTSAPYFSGIHADAAGGIYQLGSDPGSVQRAEKDKCLRK